MASVSTFALSAFAQAHWAQFRGPNGQGVAADGEPPTSFSVNSNVVWKLTTPPGHSSPCVWGDRIFLTGVDEKQLVVLGIDRKTGKELWRQKIPVAKLEKHHATSSPVSPTPAADGERVYVYCGSFGLIAYDHDGQEKWQYPIPTPKNKYGMATSPILFGNSVILVQDVEEGASRILALHRADGTMQWEQPRPLFPSGWSTPMIWSNADQPELIVLGSGRLTAYDPASGQERWWVSGFPQETVALPVAGDGLVYASSAALGGRGNQKLDIAFMWKDLLQYDANQDGKVQIQEIPENYRLILRPELPKDHPGYAFPAPFRGMAQGMDADRDGALTEAECVSFGAGFETFSAPVLVGVRPGGKGDVSQSHVAWQMRRGIPEVPSPLFYQGLIYQVRDGGLITCVDAKDGSVRYQDRLGVGGQYCASPVAGAGRIYLVSQSGTVSVLKSGESTLSILARNELAEPVFATPAIVGRTIVVRTKEHLYTFGEL